MKAWSLAIAVAATTFASSAQACIEYKFAPLYAEARIRDEKGVWRPAWIEASGKSIRIEYAHPKTPWGRLAVTGDVTVGNANVFPVSVARPVPKEAQVTWQTSLSAALTEVGLQDKFLEAPYVAIFADTERARFNGLDCFYGVTVGEYAEPDPKDVKPPALDRSVCVHKSGLPLFMDDTGGRRVFEVDKLVLRRVSPSRFTSPAGYQVTDKKPDYLKGFSC